MQRLGRKKENMGRKQIFMGLGLIMVMGLAVYLRLWTIDYNISSSETELLRRQFDLASREAMDESAQWRKRYDDEKTNSSACHEELIKVKQLLKEDSAAGIKKKLDLLQKENIDLLERLESLKQELELEKLKCSMRHI
ncbi:unnamed protein product [Withania somnifera]